MWSFKGGRSFGGNQGESCIFEGLFLKNEKTFVKIRKVQTSPKDYYYFRRSPFLHAQGKEIIGERCYKIRENTTILSYES